VQALPERVRETAKKLNILRHEPFPIEGGGCRQVPMDNVPVEKDMIIMDLSAGGGGVQVPSGAPERNKLQGIITHHPHHQDWALLLGEGEYIGESIGLVAQVDAGERRNEGTIVRHQGISGWRPKLL
jgi:hypothetical protein